MYLLVQMTRSGWTVLLAWSKAFTNACFSAVLICMIFLLTGVRLMGQRKTRGQEERECGVVEGKKENVIKNLHRHFLSLTINAAFIPLADVFSYVFEAH